MHERATDATHATTWASWVKMCRSRYASLATFLPEALAKLFDYDDAAIADYPQLVA